MEREMEKSPSVDRQPDRAVGLEVPVMVSRLLALLDSAARLTGQIPGEALTKTIADRDRTPLELAYHVPQVVVGFLDAALGGRLTREHFDRRPQAQTAADVARLHRSVSQALAVWWGANQSRLPATVDTYEGAQPLTSVLERTVRHVAQHARQLEQLLLSHGIAPEPPVAKALLDGLRLPADAWDDGVTPE
jgi:hypothetical protein